MCTVWVFLFWLPTSTSFHKPIPKVSHKSEQMATARRRGAQSMPDTPRDRRTVCCEVAGDPAQRHGAEGGQKGQGLQ